MAISDYCYMNCVQCRENLSAWLDGESGPAEEGAAAHAAACQSCQRWLSAAEAATARLRADRLTSPDLTSTIVAMAGSAGLTQTARPAGDVLRALLTGAALAQSGFGLVLVAAGDDLTGAGWNLLAGIVLLWAVVRTEVRILVLAALASSAAMALAHDVAVVHASLSHLATHALLGAGLLLLSAVCARRPAPPSASA